MFDTIMKELDQGDKNKLVLALNSDKSFVVYKGDRFVGVNTTAPTGYETQEIKGNWICGKKSEHC